MWPTLLSMGNGICGLSQSYISLIVICCLVYLTQASRYEWQASEWGECYKPYGCGKGGFQTRRVTCKLVSNGIVTTVLSRNCIPSQKYPDTRECVKLCDNENRYRVRWVYTPWGRCELKKGAKTCSKGRGIQFRNVSCVSTDKGTRENDAICSEFELKPATQQRCDYRCKQDCVVTEFSNFSNCDNCRYLNQIKTRRILIPHANGGRVCPSFSELLPCYKCSESYFISVGMWGACKPFILTERQPTDPLIGQQKRTVKCVNSLGNQDMYKTCKENLPIKEPVEPQQACIIPQDCRVSEWESWDRINSSCIDFNGNTRIGLIRRTRRVLQLPMGSGIPCPPLEEVTEVQGTAQRKCPRLRWIVSGWSTCMPVGGLKQCSTGLQHRAAICIEEDYDNVQKPVPEKRCTDSRPPTSKTCKADCHMDCTVSLWSSWSECKVTDCEQYARKRRANLKTGQRYRTREILTLPGSNGELCPHLSETQNCDPEPCYNWKITTGPCIISSTNIDHSCGRGTSHRTLACLNKYKVRVADSLCLEFRPRPLEVVDCEISCPDDCVVSNWGEWSECPDRCQKDLKQERASKIRKRTILARPFGNGRECPHPRHMEQVEECPTLIECDIFVWLADPWSNCVLEDPTQPCGRGTQRRSVRCYDSNRQVEYNEKCTDKVKPSTERPCSVSCPQDCLTTNWSDWSDCSASCLEGLNVPTRSRSRFIVQEPQNNGSPCPDKLSDVQQCVNLPLCNQYRWHKHEWGRCVLPPTSRQCGKGLHARNVTCKSENSTDHPIDVCLRFCGVMPPTHEVCYVSCERECIFTEWSEWSHCVGGCNKKQFRARVHVSGEKNIPLHCSDPDIYPRYVERTCFCEDLEPVVMGDWSECILEPPARNGLILSHLPRNSLHLMRNQTSTTQIGVSCGTGKRFKVRACKNNKNEMETADKCTTEGKDSVEEVCVIACPVDCKMSQWSSWSSCPALCGAGVQKRFRHIRQFPSMGGRKCSSLDGTKEEQTRLCHPECVQYIWKTSEWRMCALKDLRSPCGDGRQDRHVSCKSVNAQGVTTDTVGDENCAGLQRPPVSRPCYLPCQGDCVVSDWTEFSKCDQPCNHNQLQYRTRTIMREPSRYFQYRDDCPPLREQQPCVRGRNCIEYLWELSEWTTCLVNNGVDDCGVGHKERYAICKNHFGHVVENLMCTQVHGVVTEPLVMSCEIPCDVDCLLSDWSPWTACSQSCGLGLKTRNRSIVKQKIGNGRTCPNSLSQGMPCFAKGCYAWHISDWSPCSTQVGVCGYGIQKRNITCIGDNRQPVDSKRCSPDLTAMVAPREQVCHIPCPGECVTTDWSHWSQCYINCDDFHMGFRTGIRARSRAILAYPGSLNEPCPDQLWISEPCEAEMCTIYRWATSLWIDGKRNIWCERSDGLRTNGGCDPALRPSNILQCKTDCRKYRGFCNDTNTCGCTGEYKAYYDKSNKFLGCFTENVTLTVAQEAKKKADETTNVWMYAVLAAGTVFVIFVTIALYNMSDFLHYGPRPRNQSSTNDLSATTPNSRTSTIRNQNSSVTGDNCSVCKSIPSPGTPQVDSMPFTNDHTDANRYISVGSSVKPVVASSQYVPSFLTRLSVCMCCQLAKDVHDGRCNSSDQNISMNTYTYLHENGNNVLCTTALLETPKSVPKANGNRVKLSQARTDSEQSGDTQYSDSILKGNNGHKKYPSSDSAISVSVTTNSITGNSLSSTSPINKCDAKFKVPMSKEEVEDDVKPLEFKPPSQRNSIDSMCKILPTDLINDGSFDVIMQDLTNKIHSLSREETPSNKDFNPNESYNRPHEEEKLSLLQSRPKLPERDQSESEYNITEGTPLMTEDDQDIENPVFVPSPFHNNERDVSVNFEIDQNGDRESPNHSYIESDSEESFVVQNHSNDVYSTVNRPAPARLPSRENRPKFTKQKRVSDDTCLRKSDVDENEGYSATETNGCFPEPFAEAPCNEMRTPNRLFNGDDHVIDSELNSNSSSLPPSRNSVEYGVNDLRNDDVEFSDNNRPFNNMRPSPGGFRIQRKETVL